MFRSLVLFFLIRTDHNINCDDSLVLNSFNEDYKKYFTGNKCVNESEWKLLKYDTLNIKSFKGNDKGIVAVGNVCATSRAIDFIDGNIEVTVYVQAVSKQFNLLIDVYDEYDNPILCYRYGTLSPEYTPGWQRIYLRINSRETGYIKIRGRCAEGETVVMDSFLYKSDVQEINYANKIDINYEYDEESAIETDREIENENKNYDYNNFKYSETSDSFWNPFTIFFVTFAIIFGLVFIIVCVYQIGKIRGKKNDETPSTFTYDIDPPRTITIPRVKVEF